MEDSDDSGELSDDGYIETESSGEEVEREEEGKVTPQAATARASDDTGHTYIPPHLRERKVSKNQERLRKSVQGLINR